MTKAQLGIAAVGLALGVLRLPGCGQSAQPDPLPAALDAVVVRLPLSVAVDGVDGYLELEEDSRLTPQMLSRLWGTGEVDIDGDPSLQMFKSRPLRDAVIQVVDERNKVLEAKRLERPLARLRAARLRRDSRLTYLLTVDYSAGFGSYSGPVTQLVEVASGRLRWVEAIDERTGKSGQIDLMESLKTTWKFVDGPEGKGKQILLAMCRPDLTSVKEDPDFTTTYARFYFDDGRWLVVKRIVSGYADFDEGFPDRKNFP